jgi:hypothetical protein
MANYTSNLMRRQQAQAPLNTEAIGFVLQSKENKWNANQAKIDEKLSQLGSIQLEKDIDKEYLINNVSKLLGSISNAGRLDYSSDSVARSLDMALTSSIDDHIVKQVGISKKISKFNTGVQELVKKDPNSFNAQNYQFARDMAGLDAYLNDTTGEINDIGSLTYTPYVNVAEEQTKRLKEAITIKGGQKVIQIRDLDGSISGEAGTIIETTIDSLTQNEIANILPSFMDSKMQKQLEIDGYYSFNGDNGIAKEALKEFSSSILKNIDDENTELNSIITGNKDETIKNAARKKLEDNITYKDNMSKKLDRISNFPTEKIGGFLKEQELISNLSSSLKGNESIKYLKDNTYFSNLEIKVKERAARDKQDKQAKDNSSSIPDAISIPMVSGLIKDIDAYEKVRESGMAIKTNHDTKTNLYYNTLSEEDKKIVSDKMESPEYKGLSDIEKRSKALRSSKVLDYNKVGELNTLDREYKVYLEDDQEIYESNLDLVFKEDGIYNTLKGNTSMTLTDKTGKVVSYKQYFIDNEVFSEAGYKKFIDDATKSKHLKTRASVDVLLSSSTLSKLAKEGIKRLGIQRLSNNNLGKALLGAEVGNISGEMLMQFDRYAKTVGEGKEFLDVFKVTKRENTVSSVSLGYRMSTGIITRTVDAGEVDMSFINEHKDDIKQKYRIELREDAKDTETYKIIKEALKNETFDTSSILGELGLDNSLEDDDTTRTAFSFEKFKEDYRKQVGEKGIRVKGFNQIIITPSTSEKNQRPIFESLKTAIGAGKSLDDETKTTLEVTGKLEEIKNDIAITLTRDPSDKESFIIKQGGNAVLVPKSALDEMPDIYRQIELEEDEANLLVEGGKPIEIKQGELSYKDDSIPALKYLENKYGLNSMTYNSATKKGAKELVDKTTYTKDSRYSQHAKILKIAIDNYSKFSVKLKETGGTNYVEVYYDGEKISDVASGVPKGTLVNMVDYDPQVFATLALTNLASELKNEYTDNFLKLYEKVKLISKKSN